MSTRVEIALANAEEVVTADEIEEILANKEDFTFYYGTAPTGPFHFAYLIPLNKLIQLAEIGGEGTILLADYHAHLDSRKTSFEQMQIRSDYYEQCTRGILGEYSDKMKFVRGSSYQHTREYVEDLYRIAARVTTNRAKRAASEVVRQRGTAKVSELLYPLLQILDVKYLNADITVGGIDQRNIYMLGREHLEYVHFPKSSYVFMPLLPSLRGGGAKMSASDPTSHIRVTDDPENIRKTIREAYCPAGELAENPITATMRYIIFPRYGEIQIERKEKFGGDISFGSIEEFERAYVEEEVHPLDVKKTVAKALVELLEPARTYFEKHEGLLEEAQKTFQE
ncbi:MAG: tyrosine--tRNA ligase [Candidatus Thorarchaeota archaeon]